MSAILYFYAWLSGEDELASNEFGQLYLKKPQTVVYIKNDSPIKKVRQIVHNTTS